MSVMWELINIIISSNLIARLDGNCVRFAEHVFLNICMVNAAGFYYDQRGL